MFEALTGGCYCGSLRYEVSGELSETVVCHCPDCRRAVGAQSVAWIFVLKEDFAIKAGSLASCTLRPGIERFFCGSCGTSIAWES